MVILTREQARNLDHVVAHRWRLPTLVLMENAAASLERALPRNAASIVVVCGPGNNGGDGLALARRLAVVGRKCLVVLAGKPADGSDAAVQLGLAKLAGVRIRASVPKTRPGIIIDALFGTGLSREVTGKPRTLIHWTNHCRSLGTRVIAADIPSGLDADTGEPLGEAVRAHRTVTFAAAKPGLLTPTGRRHTGRLIVDPLGLPDRVIRAMLEGE